MLLFGAVAAAFAVLSTSALAGSGGIYRVPSAAMEPTLRVGVIVVVVPDPHPSVGDIIVFHPPAGALDEICGNVHEKPAQACAQPTKQPSSANYIKRIVAGPGDTFLMRNGRAYRNGKLEQQGYASFAGCTKSAPDCNYPTPIRIAAGYYFTLGDNRDQSDDSRFWGPVPSHWIIGNAFVTYWPPDRIGLF